MEHIIGSGPKAGAVPGALIKDGTTASFVADVIDASRSVPVIVDFWAPWCGPCKTLGPALEKLVREMRGAVRMVKIDVDRNPDLAAQLRVKSVPMVYAFKDGRPVDAFTGAVPESQLRAFLQRLLGGGAASLEDAVAHAQTLLEESDPQAALEVFQEILQAESHHAPAVAGLLRCLLALGDRAAAKRILDQLPEAVAAHAEVAGVKTALALLEDAPQGADLAGLRQRVADAPGQHQARFDLAMASYAQDQVEAAMDELLEIFRRDKTWNDGAARRRLVEIFDALGPTHPLTISGRKRLSSLLFS